MNKEYSEDMLIFYVIAVAVIGLFFAIFYTVKYHNYKKQRDLWKKVTESNDELQKVTENSTNDKFTKEYQRILQAVYEEKIYADLYMDRDTFAARMNLSRHTLNKIIRTNTNGQSFPKWLNNIRIEIASELLLNEPDKPVSLIAKKVGLTPNNFHRLFRSRYGVTPNEYRQK